MLSVRMCFISRMCCRCKKKKKKKKLKSLTKNITPQKRKPAYQKNKKSIRGSMAKKVWGSSRYDRLDRTDMVRKYRIENKTLDCLTNVSMLGFHHAAVTNACNSDLVLSETEWVSSCRAVPLSERQAKTTISYSILVLIRPMYILWFI